MNTPTNTFPRLRISASGAFYLSTASVMLRLSRHRVAPSGRRRQFLQWSLNKLEDYFASTNEAAFCFAVMSLKRGLGLRYWRMGQ
jgi:hypothetical protein